MTKNSNITDLDWLAYDLYLDAVRDCRNEIESQIKNNIPVEFVIDDHLVGKLEEFIEYHKKNPEIYLVAYYNEAKIKLRKKKEIP